MNMANPGDLQTAAAHFQAGRYDRAAELCEALGITATNSWVMLYRARIQLRNCLEVKWFSKEGPEET